MTYLGLGKIAPGHPFAHDTVVFLPRGRRLAQPAAGNETEPTDQLEARTDDADAHSAGHESAPTPDEEG